MRLTKKIAAWTVSGMLLVPMFGLMSVPAQAKVRSGLLPGSAKPAQLETQLPNTPQPAPAPTSWAAPVDTFRTTEGRSFVATKAQQTPSDSAAAAQAMKTRLEAPDGRTRKGLGWYLGISGLLALSSSTSAPGAAAFYLILGAVLLFTGIKKYKRIRAERAAAEANGARPFTEVRGRVGRGVLLGLMSALLLGAVFSLLLANSEGNFFGDVFSGFGLTFLIIGIVLGGILLIWRSGAFARAMQANGFGKPRRK